MEGPDEPAFLPRMDLVATARETLGILDRGSYVAPSGAVVPLDVQRCVEGSRLWSPAELDPLLTAQEAAGAAGPAPCVEVTGETTAVAARRLAAEGPVLLLNFASAVDVGGGFLRGARAQEEDLCRCSALWVCLEPQRAYYGENRSAGSDLYTDHMIVSPDVPFFRDERLTLLEAPFLASVLTAPAPCAIELRPDERARLPAVFLRRTALLLALASALGHRRLVLGAWGCGAFRNDPALVADVFARRLAHVGAAFERVVFAVYDRAPGQPNLSAFRARLG